MKPASNSTGPATSTQRASNWARTAPTWLAAVIVALAVGMGAHPLGAFAERSAAEIETAEAEPPSAEPASSEPASSEPAPTEPAPTEPAPTESAPTAASHSDTEAEPTPEPEPQTAEPQTAEPAPTPTSTETNTSGPTDADAVSSTNEPSSSATETAGPVQLRTEEAAAETRDAHSPVLLGTAESFAVLGGSTVTNTGPSVISGDLGVAPGCAVTGFPPGIVVDGTIHQCNAVAAQAQADLLTAYNQAAGQVPTQQVATQLGGQTLTAGVYDSASGTFQITGVLVLNGQGNPDSVFIFQTASTLITASFSEVRFINGAQACNVFWQVGSSATLGTDSSFGGNILALASVTANTGAVVDGRLLALNAAVTLDTNVVSTSPCLTATTGGTPGPGAPAPGPSAPGAPGPGGPGPGSSGPGTSGPGAPGPGTPGSPASTDGPDPDGPGTGIGLGSGPGIGDSSSPLDRSQQSDRGALPFTGRDTGIPILIGMAMFLLGACLRIKRPRQRPTLT